MRFNACDFHDLTEFAKTFSLLKVSLVYKKTEAP